MKIASYEVQSSSQRNYTQVSGSISKTGWVKEAELEAGKKGEQKTLGNKETLPQEQEEALVDLSQNAMKQTLKAYKPAPIKAWSPLATNPRDLKIKLLEMMLYALTGKHFNARELESPQNGNNNLDLGQIFGIGQSAHPEPMRQVTQVEQFYYESESVSYQAQGIIKTADGKSISVDVSMSLSREFVSYSSATVVWEKPKDPLVINYAGNAASLTDQKYAFDLTMDGIAEQMSFAGPGSGFLAVDWNKDGVINDGGELFGPQSGDGFAELRKYDSDGNGWIDENDEIFDKLLIWSKDENGNDQLFGLKAADVGAIFLGNIDTQFSLTDDKNNLNGMVRTTSFFLKESGGAGTISQVDLMI